MNLGVRLHGETDGVGTVVREQDALDRELTFDAELGVSEVSTFASVLGALQRGHGAPEGALVRRVSGGPLVRVGPGTLHVVLVLESPSALVVSDAAKLVNRYVRPLLRGLTKGGAPAHYFGRDWISVGHRPAGAVGFAHDASTGRAVFEAFVAVRTPFVHAGRSPRPSFLGKEPGTLEEILGRSLEPKALAELIADAYLAIAAPPLPPAAPRPILLSPPPRSRSGEEKAQEAALRAELPWSATVEEAIGSVAAGRDAAGVLRLGGDWMASRDAIARVEAEVLGLGERPSAAAVAAIVNQAFLPPAATLGVKDLGSVGRAILAAL
jgi:hypothetical protein